MVSPALSRSLHIVALVLTGLVLVASHRPPPISAQNAEALPQFERVGQYGGASHAVAAHGRHALLALGTRIEVLDLVDPEHPVKVGQVVFDHVVSDVSVSGDRGYVLDVSNRLHVLAVAEPEAPSTIDGVDSLPATEAHLCYISLCGNYIYASGPAGIGVFEVSTPDEPRWLGLSEEVGYANDVALDDGVPRTQGVGAM